MSGELESFTSLGLQAGQLGIDELQTLQLCLGLGRERVEVVILIVYFHRAHGQHPIQLNVKNPVGSRARGLNCDFTQTHG